MSEKVSENEQCIDSTMPTVPYNDIKTVSGSLSTQKNIIEVRKVPIDSEWSGFSDEMKKIIDEILKEEIS